MAEKFLNPFFGGVAGFVCHNIKASSRHVKSMLGTETSAYMKNFE